MWVSIPWLGGMLSASLRASWPSLGLTAHTDSSVLANANRGYGHYQSRDAQRASGPKEAAGHRSHAGSQTLLYESASGHWCLPAFLEVSAAMGVRRGGSWRFVVRDPGWPRGDRAIAHANEAGPRRPRTAFAWRGFRASLPLTHNANGSREFRLELPNSPGCRFESRPSTIASTGQARREPLLSDLLVSAAVAI